MNSKDKPALGKRYEYDGKATRRLNDVQREAQKGLREKIKNGVYVFEQKSCCVCGKENFEKLSEKDRYGLFFPVVICRVCGLVQANPRMTQESCREFYNKEYNGFRKDTDTVQANERDLKHYDDRKNDQAKRIYDLIVDSRAKSPTMLSGSFVVDVGCKAGDTLNYFKEKGCRVQGVDIRDNLFEYGRKKFGIDLVKGTLGSVQLKGKPDLLLYIHVLEHIPAIKEELVHIHRVLADDGIVYINVPGVKCLMHAYNRDFLQSLQIAHVYYFSLTTLKNLFESNGFEIIYGDESGKDIHGIFKKVVRGQGQPVYLFNDYKDTIEFLRSMKRKLFYGRCKDVVRKTIPYKLLKVIFKLRTRF